MTHPNKHTKKKVDRVNRQGQSVETVKKQKYIQLILCEHLFSKVCKKDMRVFRQHLEKIKNLGILPFEEKVLELSDEELQVYMSAFFVFKRDPEWKRPVKSPNSRRKSVDPRNCLAKEVPSEKEDFCSWMNLLWQKIESDSFLLPLKLSFPRYQQEFIELDSLGKGGFGSVMRVKNVLDERLYAVKKVIFLEKFLPSLNKVLREVKTLAKVEADNVVRYYSSWIEKLVTLGEDEKIVEEKESNSESQSPQFSGNNQGMDTGSPELLKLVKYGRNSEEEKESYLYTLYIQMELCDTSLREWMDSRGKDVKAEENIEIMKQLLKAVTHVHSLSIIHRDLKVSFQSFFFF